MGAEVSKTLPTQTKDSGKNNNCSNQSPGGLQNFVNTKILIAMSVKIFPLDRFPTSVRE